MSMLRQRIKAEIAVDRKTPGLWHGDRGLPARAVSPSASARAALWTTRDFGLVADSRLWGRDALTQITKIGGGKAAELHRRLRWAGRVSVVPIDSNAPPRAASWSRRLVKPPRRALRGKFVD